MLALSASNDYGLDNYAMIKTIDGGGGLRKQVQDQRFSSPFRVISNSIIEYAEFKFPTLRESDYLEVIDVCRQVHC